EDERALAGPGAALRGGVRALHPGAVTGPATAASTSGTSAATKAASMKSRTVVIIGGGVIGLSTAYQLARRKYGRIVLVEKGALGDGSSSRAAGIGTGLLWSETGVKARKISMRLF